MGFLAIAITLEADTIPRGAEEMNGLEAWRRLARYVEHGIRIR